MKKKRFTAGVTALGVLSFISLIMSVSIFVQAETQAFVEGIVIDGVTVTELNKDNIPVDSGTASYTPPLGETPAKLILSNATVTSANAMATISFTENIGEITIELIGDNHITNNGVGSAIDDQATNTITFSGGGNLTVVGGNSSDAMKMSTVVFSDRSTVAVSSADGTVKNNAVSGVVIAQENATITAIGGALFGGDGINGNLTIKDNASVTTTGGTNQSGEGGAGFSGYITQSGGTLNAYGANTTIDVGTASRPGFGIRLASEDNFKHVVSSGVLYAKGGNADVAGNVRSSMFQGSGITCNGFYPFLEISGDAKFTAIGGNTTYDATAGFGMYVKGDMTIKDNAVVTITGGDAISPQGNTDEMRAGAGYLCDHTDGVMYISDNAVFTAAGGRSDSSIGTTLVLSNGLWGGVVMNGGTVNAIGGSFIAPGSIGSSGITGSVTVNSGVLSATGGNGETSGGFAIKNDSIAFNGGFSELTSGKNSAGVSASVILSTTTPDVSGFTNPSPAYYYGADEAAATAAGIQPAPTYGETFTAAYMRIRPGILDTPDLNGDGKVNFSDVAMVRNTGNYGKSAEQAVNPTSDVNIDDVVDIKDLLLILSNLNYNN